MSVRLMAAVFDESEARGNDRLVLLAIADEANDDGKGGYPGFELLAHKCRLPKTTVRRAVDRLEALGELRVWRPEKKGRGHYTTYEVTLAEKRATLAPSENGPQRAEMGHNGPEGAAPPPPTSTDGEYAVPGTRDPEPIPKPSRAARLPKPFPLTDEMQSWARSSALSIDLVYEHLRFCDYWWGRGKTMVDWNATWRNWMRTAQKDATEGRRPNGRAGSQRFDPNRNITRNHESGRVKL